METQLIVESTQNRNSDDVRDLCLAAMDDLKAESVVVLDVCQQASFTDIMIFASGTSSRHVSAIADSLIDSAKQAGVEILGVEGETVGEWVLVDLGDVVVHIMLPDVRLYYELEKLWNEELVDS